MFSSICDGSLTRTHASFFVEAPALYMDASSHLGRILDYVEECLVRVLLRQEQEVTSTDVVIKSLYTVNKLIMSLQLCVNNFIPHIRELGIEAVTFRTQPFITQC